MSVENGRQLIYYSPGENAGEILSRWSDPIEPLESAAEIIKRLEQSENNKIINFSQERERRSPARFSTQGEIYAAAGGDE